MKLTVAQIESIRTDLIFQDGAYIPAELIEAVLDEIKMPLIVQGTAQPTVLLVQIAPPPVTGYDS